MKIRHFILFFVSFLPFSAPAQSVDGGDHAVGDIVTVPENDFNDRFLSLSAENDNFGGGTDRFYTSGVRATWFDRTNKVPPVIDKIANAVPTFELDENVATFYSIGQNIYTPEDITISAAQPNDRPWAGFLYGSVGLANITYKDRNALIREPSHIDTMEFTLGIVGPGSLAEPAQRFVHKNITDSPEPQGWDNQLQTEPGVILSWDRRFPLAFHRDLGLAHFRVEPNMGVSLGNVRTHASAGTTFVFSSEKFIDTPSRVRPAVPGTGVFLTQDDELNWLIFTGVHSRVVGRDIFLDGNSFRDSDSVDKRYFVSDFSGGASLIYDDYRLSYTLNLRTREFRGQSEDSIFGSLTFTTRF